MPYEYAPQDPAILDAEIAAGIEQAGSVFGYINNFTNNLPDGFWRSQVGDLGLMDSPLVRPGYVPEGDENTHSARARTVTWRQFFEDVDRAVEESGVDQLELARLQALADNPSQEEAQETYSRFALPIYRLLRIWGYSSFDLRR